MIAGSWKPWTHIETGEDAPSATRIVTTANRFMAEIHDRMPVLLARAQVQEWISGRARAQLLKASAEGVFKRWRVSTRVNPSRTAHTSELIAPV